MGAWVPTFNDAAKDDLKRLKKTAPYIFNAICDTMELLSTQDDPRKPRTFRLNVCEIEVDAPGWWRVRVIGHNWRIVFRILEQRGDVVVEIHAEDELSATATRRALEIMRVTHRHKAYGKDLRIVYQKAS